ncbi:MAG: endonuclease/exonuclease/phosphatase family protein [Candidatus Saccharimonadales bacterium]
MRLRVAAWNVEGRLSNLADGRRGTPAHILEGIAALDADIIVLPEAYVNKPQTGVDRELASLGYSWQDVRYDDSDRGNVFSGQMPYLRILSRLPITTTHTVQFGGLRRLLVVTVQDTQSMQSLRIVATHLDDRTEERRLMQIDDMISLLSQHSMPTLVMGDFNAMWPGGRAILLRSRLVASLVRCLPHGFIKSASLRVLEMASGTTMKRLKSELNLHDADARHQATTTPKMRQMVYMPSIRLIQIDHILLTATIKSTDFKVARDGGSDHRAISTTIIT